MLMMMMMMIINIRQVMIAIKRIVVPVLPPDLAVDEHRVESAHTHTHTHTYTHTHTHTSQPISMK
jgi:hypothetical protein